MRTNDWRIDLFGRQRVHGKDEVRKQETERRTEVKWELEKGRVPAEECDVGTRQEGGG